MTSANTGALTGPNQSIEGVPLRSLQPRIVLKFGSSVLQDPSDVPTAVHEIYRYVRAGYQVLAVVSAIGSTTDELLEGAHSILDQHPVGTARASVASLLATGELHSVALLALGLARAGLPSLRLDDTRTWIRTSGDPLDADPIGLDTQALERSFQEHTIAILPGFVGVDPAGNTTVLGRGGSDLSALYVAWKWSAERCRLLKDVDGVYDTDPNEGIGRRFQTLSWTEALERERQVLQTKALEFANRHRLNFEVGTPLHSGGTTIGVKTTRRVVASNSRPRLRVGLLGHGTVGGGVAHRLAALSDRFELVRIAVQDIEKHVTVENKELLTTDWREVIAAKPDVIIECIGGVTTASDIIREALHAGCHVITANKAVVAAQGRSFRALAEREGLSIRYGASVGGVAPFLERVDALRASTEITSVNGVINGTCNDVLDRIGQGASFPEAIQAAQEAGFAEADPSRDVDGVDAAEKLAILIHHAFGEEASVSDISCEGIATLDEHAIRRAQRTGRRFRLVATAERTALGIRASVRPVILPNTHPLARVGGAENRLLVRTRGDQRWTIDGTGAGRWPTTEAIIGDLLALANVRETIDPDTQEVIR